MLLRSDGLGRASSPLCSRFGSSEAFAFLNALFQEHGGALGWPVRFLATPWARFVVGGALAAPIWWVGAVVVRLSLCWLPFAEAAVCWGHVLSARGVVRSGLLAPRRTTVGGVPIGYPASRAHLGLHELPLSAHVVYVTTFSTVTASLI